MLFILARSLTLTYVSTSYTVLCGKSRVYEVKIRIFASKAVSPLMTSTVCVVYYQQCKKQRSAKLVSVRRLFGLFANV